MVRSRLLLASSAFAAYAMIASPALAQSAPQAPPPAGAVPAQSADARTDTTGPVSTDSGSSDDIIVTANKREERVLDVAGAITAFRGDDLLASGTNSIRDLAGFTPGLQFNNGLGSGAPIIRGLSQGIDTSPTVATVVNGAPIGSSSTLAIGAQDTLDVDPIDIVRVEVLKGPQGTLYGANTLGGLISYTLRAPSLTETDGIARAEVSATEHGDPSYGARLAISTPIIRDMVGIGFSGFYDRRGGFIDNARRNLQDQNHSTNWGAHGGLLFKPTDRLRIGLDGFYQRLNVPAGDAVVYNADHRPRDGDLRYDEYSVPSARKRSKVGIATVDYDLDFANLSSVTSLQRIRSDNAQNLTNSAAGAIFFNTLPLFGGQVFPTPRVFQLNRVTTYKKTTQEVRLTSPGDQRFSWIVGGYYSDEHNDYAAVFSGRNTTGGAAPGLANALDVNLISDLKEYSGFVNGTFKITPTLDVTGGFRIGGIDQGYRQVLTGTDATAYNTLLLVAYKSVIPLVSPVSKTHDTVKNYLATLRYHFSPDGMVFARFSTGFRPGGPNLAGPGLPPNFQSDQTKNYEAGLKTRFLDGRGSIDITGYYTKWQDIIVVIQPAGLAGYTTGGDARVYGVEAALNMRPVPPLTLTATFAYAKGNIIRSDPRAASALVKGDSLPYSPRTSGSLSAEYKTPLSGDWSAYGSGAFRFSAARNSLFASNPLNYRMPSYQLLDLHAGVENSSYTVDLFVRNVTDSRAQTATNSFYGLNEVTVQRPRTYGIGITAKF